MHSVAVVNLERWRGEREGIMQRVSECKYGHSRTRDLPSVAHSTCLPPPATVSHVACLGIVAPCVRFPGETSILVTMTASDWEFGPQPAKCAYLLLGRREGCRPSRRMGVQSNAHALVARCPTSQTSAEVKAKTSVMRIPE